ncbi:YedE family putative selenium transporter [Desulfoplanes formicivorans]|uniref:Membrane protein n=1 Tax=Desulfoplanes formicivorans TaxID=1592317 RepID=A0A194ABY7_9BACT|nr:YedE family putative selenium transporter [Desulfoplanes formicivorans]GAU07662.1 membrane protein [Desulfoplanes formicivorans]
MKNHFASKWGIIGVGAAIGVLAALLQKLGNPGNMGICVACFERDIAGAFGLHRAGVVQYLRPEIVGFVLGSCGAALAFRDFRPRTGSAPFVRFVLGIFAMIGALVFLGCPWRAMLRLAGGDMNAIFGLLGLIAGVYVGTLFLKNGYNLGPAKKTHPAAGLLISLIMLGFLALALIYPQIEGQPKNDILFYSLKGPGAMHAPFVISLAIGLGVGILAQRSRFCTMGAFRDLILFKQTHLFGGVVALIVAAFLANLAMGQFHAGFAGQPVAHTQGVWNFMGMVLAGLAFALAGGCPGRQLFLAGEGDGDAAVFVFGMIVGAGFAHNFGLASSPKGVGPHGIAAVIIGLIVCLGIGWFMRKQRA